MEERKDEKKIQISDEASNTISSVEENEERHVTRRVTKSWSGKCENSSLCAASSSMTRDK